MSLLAGHAKATRLMAEAFDLQASDGAFDAAGIVMRRTAAALFDAASAMEQAIRDEIAANPGGCGVDHALLTLPRCPACGAAKPK